MSQQQQQHQQRRAAAPEKSPAQREAEIAAYKAGRGIGLLYGARDIAQGKYDMGGSGEQAPAMDGFFAAFLNGGAQLSAGPDPTKSPGFKAGYKLAGELRDYVNSGEFLKIAQRTLGVADPAVIGIYLVGQSGSAVGMAARAANYVAPDSEAEDIAEGDEGVDLPF